jgi:hypothetical protein
MICLLVLRVQYPKVVIARTMLKVEAAGESVGTIWLADDDEATRKLIRVRLADTDKVIET